MIYVWDLIFIVVYVACEKLITILQNKRPSMYVKTRDFINWLQFITILLYLYGRPIHNGTERLVSFGIMAFTKFIVDIITNNFWQKEKAELLERCFKNEKNL